MSADLLAHVAVKVESQEQLDRHFAALPPPVYAALDIETANWWSAVEERIALIQLAYRRPDRCIEVALIDAQPLVSLASLAALLEDAAVTVAVHNAGFDVVKLHRHFGIRTRSVHCTMRAARRAGAKRYSLAALVHAHFGVELDKGEQRSDWGRRPFSASQLEYAARDAVGTLLLYERQTQMGLAGGYEWTEQPELRAAEPPASLFSTRQPPTESERPAAVQLDAIALAALGLLVKKPHYYSPDRLVVALGEERSGLAGYLIDRLLGADALVEEGQARLAIASLAEAGGIGFDAYGKLIPTPAGARRWQEERPADLS